MPADPDSDAVCAGNKSEPVSSAPADGGSDNSDGSVTAAQLKVKLAQARLETKMAADDEQLALRKRLIEIEYALEEQSRASERADERYRQLQASTNEILAVHRQTLAGMRDELLPDKLVAALETEKAMRSKLQAAFEEQNKQLLAAERRVEELTGQVLHYQKTETVLAQSVTHFQHRVDAKEQQRAELQERTKRELELQYADELTKLRHEAQLANRTEQLAQDELLAVRRQYEELQARERAAIERQTGENARHDELLATIERLETEKAVLQSRAEQVEKADAQLRSKVNAQSDELDALRKEKEALQVNNADLGAMATELLEMVESQNQDKRKRQSLEPPTDGAASSLRKDEEFVRQRKKRLRRSLG